MAFAMPTRLPEILRAFFWLTGTVLRLAWKGC